MLAACILRGRPIPKSAGHLAVVVTDEDVSIAAEPLDMLGAASVVVSDSSWTLSQLDAIYRLPSAVIVFPENDEADVTTVGGVDPVTVGLLAEDLGEGAILHNRKIGSE